MQAKLIDNIRQQTKRLVDQLRQLQENKADLTQQQYLELKQSTLEDLKTFQKQLENMQKGETLLASEIEKSRELIMKVCRDTFNMEKITNSLLSSQAKSLRDRIGDLDKNFHLGKISEPEYVKSKRGLIVQIQDSGVPLAEEESSWIDTNHFTNGKQININNFEGKQGEKHMYAAEKDIKQLKD